MPPFQHFDDYDEDQLKAIHGVLMKHRNKPSRDEILSANNLDPEFRDIDTSVLKIEKSRARDVIKDIENTLSEAQNVNAKFTIELWHREDLKKKLQMSHEDYWANR